MKFSKTLTAALAGYLVCVAPVSAAPISELLIDFEGSFYGTNPISSFEDTTGAVTGDIMVDSATKQAWIYNTDPPNGEDKDLENPFYNAANYDSGNGRDDFNDNDLSGLTLKDDFDNVLIIQEPSAPGDSDPATNPDDDAKGGTIIFDFDIAVTLLSIDLLDASEGNVTLQLTNSAGTTETFKNLHNSDSGNSTPNWYETVFFNTGVSDVLQLKVQMANVSGAIDNIVIDSSSVPQNVVPIPAAAWLFASALGLFGYLGKRKSKA